MKKLRALSQSIDGTRGFKKWPTARKERVLECKQTWFGWLHPKHSRSAGRVFKKSSWRRRAEGKDLGRQMSKMDANANADARKEVQADVAPLCCGCFAFWSKKEQKQGENGKSETRAHPAALQKNFDRVAARTTAAATAAATARSPSQSVSDEVVEFEAKHHQAQESDEFVDVSLDDESSDKSNDADEAPSRPSTPLSLRKRKLLPSPRRRRSRANDDDLAPIEPSSPGTPGLVPDVESKQATEPSCDMKKKLSGDTKELSAPPCKDSNIENSVDHVSNEHSSDMQNADDFVDDDDSNVDESNKKIEFDEPATPAVEPPSASSEEMSRESELSTSDTDRERSGASAILEMSEEADEKAKESATGSPTDDIERETSPEVGKALDHTVEKLRTHDSASENSQDAECSPNDTDTSLKKAEDESSKTIVVEMQDSTPASHQDKHGCAFKTEATTDSQSKESMITKNAKDAKDEEEEADEEEKEAESKEDESAGNTRWLEIKDSKTGRMYYYNESTRKSVWKKPADFDRQSVLLAMEERRKGEVDWVEAVDEFGRVYYFDQNTMAARWDRPASLSLPEVATQLKQEKNSLAPVDTKTKVPARKEIHSPTYIARSFGSRARSATSKFHSRVGHICGTNDGNIVEQPHK